MRFLEKNNLELINRETVRKQPISSLNRSRLLFGFLLLLFLMILLILKMGYIQIYKSQDLKASALEMQKIDTEIEPVRGIIYDSGMNVLAETSTEYELYGYTQYMYKDSNISITEKEVLLNNLVKLTGKDRKELLKKLEGKENLVLLGSRLTKEQVDKAEKLWGSNVMVKTRVSRYYPNGAFASQLLGGVNDVNAGRTGLEFAYNSDLAGVKGRTVKTTDNQGNDLAEGIAKYYEAKDGYNIVTTIDSLIQHYVEDALQNGMKRTGASGLSCIVMDPNTGNILAIAQTPEYDPNDSYKPSNEEDYKNFKKLNDKEQTKYLNKMWTLEPVSHVYEPGSTFKLIATAAALESNSASMKSTYYCGGSIKVYDANLKCLGHHGRQSLKVAVAHSCNAAFAQVALNMGAQTFYNYIDLFGFNDISEVDLPGETNSIVKDPDWIGPVDLATTGYGQGIAVTPIQMLSAVNACGNGGYLMQPKVVSKVVDNNGKTVKEYKNVVVRQVISEETSNLMREIMEYYPTQSGGSKAYIPGYRVGGKTGTANIAEGGKYSTYTDCSYVAMAPMDDPQISVLVIVHRPTKTEYGNMSAGPIVKEILEKSLMYLGVERKYTESEEAKVKSEKVSVPNVKGMDSKKAIELLYNNHLKYQIVPESNDEKSFVVIDQYPKSGTKVGKDTMVYLYSE